MSPRVGLLERGGFAVLLYELLSGVLHVRLPGRRTLVRFALHCLFVLLATDSPAFGVAFDLKQAFFDLDEDMAQPRLELP